jgi:hypothetical protein
MMGIWDLIRKYFKSFHSSIIRKVPESNAFKKIIRFTLTILTKFGVSKNAIVCHLKNTFLFC